MLCANHHIQTHHSNSIHPCQSGLYYEHLLGTLANKCVPTTEFVVTLTTKLFNNLVLMHHRSTDGPSQWGASQPSGPQLATTNTQLMTKTSTTIMYGLPEVFPHTAPQPVICSAVQVHKPVASVWSRQTGARQSSCHGCTTQRTMTGIATLQYVSMIQSWKHRHSKHLHRLAMTVMRDTLTAVTAAPCCTAPPDVLRGRAGN